MSFEKDHVFHEEDSIDSHASDDARIFGSDELAAADTKKINGDITIKIPTPEVAALESSSEQASESPKSLFMQAYEAVRNTDKVSNVVDNISIWWKGRHIDSIEKDVQRLEDLGRSQQEEAGKHENRLRVSDEVASHLGEMKQSLGVRDTAPSDSDRRQGEYEAVKGRAEAHRTAGEKIARELAAKRELKGKFEQDREDARSRIAERFRNNIETNRGAIQSLDGNINDIQKNLEVANTIVEGLRAKQEVARSFTANADVLSADKTVAQALARDLEGRIQDMQSKIQLQRERITQYETKKAALEIQKVKWESRITNKTQQVETKQEELSDEEKIESFAEETENQLREQEDAALGGVEVNIEPMPDSQGVLNESEKAAPVIAETETDPRVALLEDLQELIQDPDMKKYDDPDFQELVLEGGTLEQKLLLRTHSFFNQLFGFLESRAEIKEEQQLESEQATDRGIVEKAIKNAHDRIGQEDIEQYIGEDDIARIEKSGTKEERLISKLLQALIEIFTSFEVFDGREESSKDRRKKYPL